MLEDNSPSICRVCLAEEGEFQSIFVCDEDTGHSIHLSEMIMAFASVQVTFGDGLPETICTTCARDTVKLYLFKLQCEESDKTLRNQFGKSPLKQTILDENNSYEIKEDVDYFNIVVKPEFNSEESRNQLDNEFDGFNDEKSDSELDSSEIFADNTQKEFKCPECSKIFNKLATFNRHIKTHSAVKEYHCNICNKAFSRNDLLLRHKIAHAMKMADQSFDLEKDEDDDEDDDDDDENETVLIKTETDLYPCAQCSLLFVNKDSLETHLLEHNKTKEDIICTVCSKKFSKQAHLNRHMKIHSPNKPYVCSTCNKGFVRSEQLNNHMNIHSGVKPHVCAICLKGVHIK